MRAGWWLALLYLISAVMFTMLIVFIPFGIKALKFCMCAAASAAFAHPPLLWWLNLQPIRVL